ncbi:hypothetical protein J40TS1_00470 [Paenibacillus montaniterrae]|uniref:Tail fiber protein n=1 Tax=Paenibacillus montaniterrae TaxID=429341 RepID=A0A920CVQ9_9BACL|nr:tail fiber protein [Paenibacillus montaniterrae]GIP14405.1 hypothetical protein J40TS1_00470 [Paenibacillus montaniterrae]
MARYLELGPDENIDATYQRIPAAFDKVQSDIAGLQTSATAAANHAANKSNPHAVTKAQVGLGNVDNYATATQAQAEAGTTTNAFMTPQRTAQAITALSPSAAPVKSVAGKTGAVTLTAADIAETSSGKIMTAAERTKLASVSNGAQPNQNAYASINGIAASAQQDSFTIEGGIGIDITKNAASKQIIVTATGDAIPGKHGVAHLSDGADPIPNATLTVSGLMSPGMLDMLQKVNGRVQVLSLNQYRMSTPGTDYPIGLSVMETTGTGGGWPFTYGNGQVFTLATTANNVTQTLFETVETTAKQRVWTRIYRADYGGWSPAALQVNREIATQAQAEAGTDNTTDMTPLRVAQAITKLAPAAPVQSVAGKTGAVTLTGTDIPAATTSARGTVQLSTATNSTSTTLAATASAVKAAYDRAEAAFQSASEGKSTIASALSGKSGVSASSSETWASLAGKINNYLGTRVGYSWDYYNAPTGFLNGNADLRYYGFTSDGKYFYILTGGGKNLYKSENGETWTSQSTNINVSSTDSRQIRMFEYLGDSFFCVSVGQTSDTSNWMRYSSDGINWGIVGLPSGSHYSPVNNQMVYGGNPSKYVFVTSRAGYESTQISIYVSPGNVPYTYSQYFATTLTGSTIPIISYGNNIFVIVKGREVLTSTDATTWTSHGNLLGQSCSSIQFVNGYFMALGGTAIYISSNGTTWTTISPVNPSPIDVAFTDGVYVYCSSSNQREASIDEFRNSTAVNLQSGTWIMNGKGIVSKPGMFLSIQYSSTTGISRIAVSRWKV